MSEILLVNPRRKRRRNKRAKAKRRPAMGYTVGSRKIRRRKLNRRHRSRRRSNPRFSIRGVTGLVVPAATGAAGAVALDILMGYVPLPAFLQNPWGNAAAKGAGAVLLGFGAGKVFGKRTGVLFTAGALTVIAYQVIKSVATQALGDKAPAGLTGVQDFVDYQRGGNMGAYMRPALSGSTGMDVNLGYMNPAGVLADNDLSSGDGMGAYMTDMGM